MSLRPFLQTSASEEYQELMKSFYGLTSAPRAWWLEITQKLSQLGWKPMSTDQCLWCRYSDDGELKGVIGIHVDDFLIGLADRILGEKWMSEIKSLYHWGSWKASVSEFAGIRVRQYRDFSITVGLEDYTNKLITEAPTTRERSRQRQESLTAQELSMLRGVLGTASWRAQQLSPQCAADVGFVVEVATTDPVVQDLLDANKLVREICAAVLHSLFIFTPTMRLRGKSWSLLRGPMRAIVPVQMDLGQEVL